MAKANLKQKNHLFFSIDICGQLCVDTGRYIYIYIHTYVRAVETQCLRILDAAHLVVLL